ncbi:MAG: ATP-dependent DNA helicase RecG [Mariprofundaceae bacterium]|nr:ATP-dependent DNA helicase RecG [Mariprofundaceae bacterium]
MYNFFFQPLDSIQGIGISLKKRLEARSIRYMGDLLCHLPRDYLDDRLITPISALKHEKSARIQARIIQCISHGVGAQKKVSIKVEDGTGQVNLHFFHAAYLLRDARLQEGRVICVRGVAQSWGQSWQMTHPEWTTPERFIASFKPIYGMLAGISGQRLRGFIQSALTMMPQACVSPLDAVMDMPLREALKHVHQPNDIHAAVFQHAMQRLKAEELLVYLKLMQEKRRIASVAAPLFQDSSLAQKFIQALPYDLTSAQQHAWVDIQGDLNTGKRMHRLIQGDVGSGKTWVAALAMLQAIQAGFQVAFMAPTEVLAQQHQKSLSELLEPLGVQIALLTGSTRAAQRKKILKGLLDGELQALVGTHALISEDVIYRKLGLAIVDEQHRFGVKQRWALTEKTQTGQKAVHLLAMTATPIPRSLALAVYGDLDLTVMKGMPKGRKKVETRVLSTQKFPDLSKGIQRLLNQGGRIYWIVPRIEQDEEQVTMSVDARVESLRPYFEHVGLQGLHGRMKSKEKQQILNAFTDGTCRFLVSTTVVEVGVNVPEARLIVIEDADCYGLAQLHQLRGRVGRSNEQGYCMLVPSQHASNTALKRLKLMVQHHDGLELAEMDLTMRGSGDAIGTQQSGDAGFRLLNMQKDMNWVRHWHENMPNMTLNEAMIRFWRPMKDSVD